MTHAQLRFVCPICRGPLEAAALAYTCAACPRDYPIVCGIPDFRIEPDPFIGIVDDRAKGQRLLERAAGGRFEDALRDYYAQTPEDPPDLAARWIAHALADVQLADALLGDAAVLREQAAPPSGALLDVGCSTGGLLIAAKGAFAARVGVDVAFRWLAVGSLRLREAGVEATLVCANAERLPFADRSFQAVTCTDTLEHVRDIGAAAREAYRVSSDDAVLIATANNRYAPLPEPNIGLWGVGYLPRRWQARYVATRRRDLHPYGIRLRSARELARICRTAGFAQIRVDAPPLAAPHLTSRAVRRGVTIYNALRTWPLARRLLTVVGPRLRVTGRRP